MSSVTASERGTRGCPDLASLEIATRTPTVQLHVDQCVICKLVVEVCDGIKRADDDCLHYDALLAARSDGTLNTPGKNLLERHLASCEACRAVADTLSPPPESEDIVGLPSIEGAAYTLGNEVGRGGMGRVIDARDLRVGRPVVIKELLGRSAKHAARFEREARLTARLQHPGIVPIYEIGKWSSDHTPFYAMRKIEGRTLQDSIESAPTLPERLALLPSLIAACETVAFAHAKRVIHRDLKPSNIMIGKYGETIVIDWGLAKDLSEPGDEPEDKVGDAGTSDRLTGVGQAMGTAAYMPFEQAYGETSERSDVYSLGAILYQVLAGTPPYRGVPGSDLLNQVRSGPPKPIDEVAREAPGALLSIVTRAMGRKPEERYPSAAELAKDLNRFQTGLLVEAHTYSRGELVRRFLRRHRAPLTVTALAAVLVAVVAVISIRGILRSRAAAQTTARELLFEEGRVESLAGNHLRALAYLDEARRQGEGGSALQLLIGASLHDLASEATLDCGGDDRYVDVSHDGTLLAAGCHDRAVVWRVRASAAGPALAEPQQIATLEVTGSHGGFDNVQFSADDSLLATWGEEGIARLWRVGALVTGNSTPFRTFSHRQSTTPSRINLLTISRDNRRVSTTGNDGFARIWEIESGASLREIDAAAGRVVRRLYGQMTPDGERVFTMTFSGIGKGFKLDDGAELGTFEHGTEVVGGELSPDGTRASACSLDGVTKIVDVASGAVLYELVGHTDVVWKCVFSHDGTRVLTASHDGTAKVWELGRSDAGKPHPRLITTATHGDLIWIARFSPDASRFVTISPGKSMKVWDSTSGALLATYGSRGKDARFLPDNRLAALRGDGRIELWARASSRLASYSPKARTSVAGITSDGDCMALLDDTITLVRASTNQRLQHQVITTPIAVADRRIAGLFVTPHPEDPSRSTTGIAVLDAGNGKTIATFGAAEGLGDVGELWLSANGARLAVTWSKRAPEIWDVVSHRRLVVLAGANRVVLSTDGTRAVAWTELDPNDPAWQPPTQPVVWSVDSGAPIATLPAIDARPIGFAHGGNRVVMTELASASAPAASIWDVDHARRVMMQYGVAIAPTIDPEGRWVTTIGTDRKVTVRSADTGREHHAFLGDKLQSAQADRDGELIVAIGDYARSVMILAAADGRELARHKLDHDRVYVSPDSFGAPPSLAWWSPDSSAIVTRSRGMAVWGVTRSHDDEHLAKTVRKYVPWQLDNGRLVLRSGRVSGLILRGGEPVAGAKLELLLRRPADIGDKEVNWESMKLQRSTVISTSGSDGSFAIANLAIGNYELTITADGVPQRRAIYVGPDEDLDIDLSLVTAP